MLHFKSIIVICPFKISADNYHAVDDNVLDMYKTASLVGSRRVTRVWKQQNAPCAPGVLCHTHYYNIILFWFTLLPMVESSMDPPTYNRGWPICISYYLDLYFL